MSLPPEFIECISQLPGAKARGAREGRLEFSYQGYIYHWGSHDTGGGSFMDIRTGWWRGGVDNSDLNALLAQAIATHPTSPWWYRGPIDRAVVDHLLQSRFWDYLNLVILGYLVLMFGIGAFQDLAAQNWFEGFVVLFFYLVFLVTLAVQATRLYLRRRSSK